ncbi:MAG: FGGY family carbohydrate kinase [Bacteroides sp.]|nr:FGGY family carbohydrate kinase [Bacteroides sp.]
MHTIVIDCGASFIKGALFSEDNILKSTQRQAPVLQAGHNLLTPVQLDELVPLVEALIMELALGIGQFKLCISNEMHGFLLADKTGRPYTDYISWQKEYGNEEIEGMSSVGLLSQAELSQDILHSGMPLRGGLPSTNLLYIKRKGLLERTSEDLYFYTLGDYIIRVLSGREPICHLSNAAATGLYDLSRSEWNSRLIGFAVPSNIRFPKVGTEALEFSYRQYRVVCLPAIGDQQAALWGAGLEKENDLSFNIGTGAQVSHLTKELRFSSDYQTRPYFDGWYLKSVPHLPSGRALNVYIRFFKDVLEVFGLQKSDAEIWEVLLREEKKCETSGIQCDLSFFQNPLTDHRMGSIRNIGEHSLRTASLMKAVLGQMGDNFVKVADKLEPDKTKVQRIVFSGGVARRIESLRSHILRHYMPDMPYVVAQEETMQGLNKYGKIN